MAKNKPRMNLDGLDKIAKAIKESKLNRVQVGIFEDKNARIAGDLGNADIGARMEFGFTIAEGPFAGVHVAPRSFLRMPIQTHIGEIGKTMHKTMQQDVVPLFFKDKMEFFFKNLGIACEKIIDQAFASSGWGTWKPNSPITIILKSSDDPLIHTTQLRRSIASKVKK